MSERNSPSIAGDVLAGAVRAYQLTIRPLIGGHCRFEPSCSHYAIEAFRRHGAARGAALSARRILSCNPWHEGGFDPVPDHIISTSPPARTAR